MEIPRQFATTIVIINKILTTQKPNGVSLSCSSMGRFRGAQRNIITLVLVARTTNTWLLAKRVKMSCGYESYSLKWDSEKWSRHQRQFLETTSKPICYLEKTSSHQEIDSYESSITMRKNALNYKKHVLDTWIRSRTSLIYLPSPFLDNTFNDYDPL